MGRRLAGLLHSMLDSVLPRGTVAVVQARPVVRAYSSRASAKVRNAVTLTGPAERRGLRLRNPDPRTALSAAFS